MLTSQDYDCLALPNSPVEFVIVGERKGKFKPILKSSNCGLDLLGFAASESYSRLEPELSDNLSASRSQFARRKDDNSYDFQRKLLSSKSENSEYIDSSRPMNFMIFWYGTKLSKNLDQELEFISKINLPGIFQLYQGNDIVSDSDLGFVEWHVSPIIKILADANYDAAESNRISIHRPNEFMDDRRPKNNDLSKTIFRISSLATIAAMGAAIASLMTLLGF